MSVAPKRVLLWRIGLGLVTVLLLWRIVTLGISRHYGSDIGSDDGALIQKTLAWNASDPKTLYVSAAMALLQKPSVAIELARKSLQSDPTNAMPLLVLANAHLALGEAEQADRYAQQAALLMPSKGAVRLGLAEYWMKREQAGQALVHLDTALRIEPELHKELFPYLLKVAESAEARAILAPLAKDPSPWWEEFFNYVCRRAVSLETVSALTYMRRVSAAPLTGKERAALVDRLLKEKQWPAAYLAWVNGLDRSQTRYLGSVYNGGFEGDVSDTGFDWRLPRVKGVNAARRHTYGISGEKALHLVFAGRELRFNHLRQRLFLAPGNYRFSSMMRPDRLQGRGGLSWIVRCAESPEAVLGQSERFLGASDWRWSKFDFFVPSTGCVGQVLGLESLGRTPFDHKLEGEIWLDQVSIRKIEGVKVSEVIQSATRGGK